MARIEPAVAAWMRAHRSTASDQALRELGVSEVQRRELVRTGQLVRVIDGAYALAAVELDELGRCAAVCAARPNLLIAGPTAGRIWPVRRSPHDGLVHAIGPAHSQPCRESWLRVFRTDALTAEDVVVRGDGIRLTSPPFTVVDLARFLPRDELASAVEHVLAERICSEGGLRRVADRINVRGRPWVRRFLSVLDERVPGAPCESEWELRVFMALRARGVVDLERQHRQRLRGHGTVRFDLAVPDIRWVVEVDVHPWHRTVDGSSGDNRRDRFSRRAGWAVERIGASELGADFDGLMDELAESVALRRQEVNALRTAGLWGCDERSAG